MPRVQADLLMGFGGCTGLYPQPQATPEVSAVPAQHVACLDHLPRPSRSLLPQAHCYPEHIQHDGGRRGIGALLVAGNPPLTDWPSQTLAGSESCDTACTHSMCMLEAVMSTSAASFMLLACTPYRTQFNNNCSLSPERAPHVQRWVETSGSD